MADIHHLLPRRTLIEGVIGIVLLIMAFFAIAASDASALKTRTYWTVVVVVYALAALAIDRLYPGRKSGDGPSALYVAVHWVGVFCAIQLVYFFVSSGRMARADMGLTNGLILALGTFLGGVHGNWRLLVTGLALALATAGVAFIEQYLWFLAGVALVTVLAILFGSHLLKVAKQAKGG